MSSSQLALYELHYNLGHVLHQQGDLVGAAQSYQQAISLQPSYANAHLNLAIVLDEQGQFEAAIDYYRQAIELQPDLVKAHNNLGCTLARLKRFDAAIQIYQRAIALCPDWATLHNNLGQAFQSQGKVAEAIEAYRCAIKLQPDLVLAHYNLGKLLQSQGHYAKAIACFQQTIQLDSNYFPAYGECSATWLAQGKLEQALPYLRQAIAHQSQFVEAYWQWTLELSDRSSNSESELETEHLTQARIACGQFLHALQHQGDLTTLRQHLAQTYLHLAHTLTIYGGTVQYRQAQTYYQRVLQLQPNHLEAYLGLGDCLVKQKKYNSSLLLYHFALTICPNPIPLHVQLGKTLEQQAKFEEAIAHYRQALQSDQSSNSRSGKPLRLENVQKKEAPVRQNEEPTPEPIPPGIYPSTLDWLTATHPTSTHYIKLQFPHPDVSSDCPSPSLPPAICPDIPPKRLQLSTHPPACQGLNCQPCLKQIFDRLGLVHLGKGIYSTTPTNAETVPLVPAQSALFVATIPQGSIWAAPHQNHWLICNAIAVLTPDRHLLSDLSRSYPGQLPGCQHPELNHHSIFQLESLPAKEKIDGTVAVLTGLSGHNYYHWMIDILPRLALLQTSGLDLAQIDWFLVNSIRQPFQRATLEAIGVPLEKTIASDEYSHVQADQLVVPSFPGPLGWPEAWSLAFLRQQFLPLVKRSSLPVPYPERIYISRAQANHRRVLNEAEVMEQLKPYGFVSIQLESLSFVDQIALFANARIIVAPHGGGLTNTVFCCAETIIVELVNLHYIRHYFLTISQQLRLKHYLVTSEGLTCHPVRQLMYPSPLMEDLWINPEPLVKLLQTLIG